jgi:hypothetical protein
MGLEGWWSKAASGASGGWWRCEGNNEEERERGRGNASGETAGLVGSFLGGDLQDRHLNPDGKST